MREPEQIADVGAQAVERGVRRQERERRQTERAKGEEQGRESYFHGILSDVLVFRRERKNCPKVDHPPRRKYDHRLLVNPKVQGAPLSTAAVEASEGVYALHRLIGFKAWSRKQIKFLIKPHHWYGAGIGNDGDDDEPFTQRENAGEEPRDEWLVARHTSGRAAILAACYAGAALSSMALSS